MGIIFIISPQVVDHGVDDGRTGEDVALGGPEIEAKVLGRGEVLAILTVRACGLWKVKLSLGSSSGSSVK